MSHPNFTCKHKYTVIFSCFSIKHLVVNWMLDYSKNVKLHRKTGKLFSKLLSCKLSCYFFLSLRPNTSTIKEIYYILYKWEAAQKHFHSCGLKTCRLVKSINTSQEKAERDDGMAGCNQYALGKEVVSFVNLCFYRETEDLNATLLLYMVRLVCQYYKKQFKKQCIINFNESQSHVSFLWYRETLKGNCREIFLPSILCNPSCAAWFMLSSLPQVYLPLLVNDITRWEVHHRSVWMSWRVCFSPYRETELYFLFSSTCHELFIE